MPQRRQAQLSSFYVFCFGVNANKTIFAENKNNFCALFQLKFAILRGTLHNTRQQIYEWHILVVQPNEDERRKEVEGCTTA